MQEFVNLLLYFLFQLNWIDWIIILIAIFYMIEGYAVGAISGIFDILSFLLSFAAGLRLYKPLGVLLGHFITLPQGFVHIVTFAFAAVVAEMLLRFLQEQITGYIQKQAWLHQSIFARANRYLGIIPGLFSGLILLAFLLTVMIVLPVSTTVKQTISASKLSNPLISQAQTFERTLTNIFGSASNDLLTFFTVEPNTNSTVILDFQTANGVVDETAEEQMLLLVNEERKKRNIAPVVMDASLRQVARLHSQDMLTRGYFSHYTPEGKSPFDRMNAAGIQYTYAGENLAFSANVQLAMQGLMQSPGHKANILSEHFKKIGIGVINAGVYGEMFSQEFSD